MAKKISESLRRKVTQRAKGHCEYCLASEEVTGQQFHVDHIVPRIKGGKTSLENLCLACPACNGAKLDHQTGDDPESGKSVTLFDPRQYLWTDHFKWDAEGIHIVGLTEVGRVTVKILKMNRPLVVTARRIWILFHRHPPGSL